MELYAALYYYFAHRVAMYGVMAALGTALAVLYLRRAEKRFPETAADAELVFIYGLLGMFVGAKLLSLLTVLPELRADLPLLTSDIGAFFRKYLYAGFVFYGGLYGILSAVWLYAKLAGCQFALLARAYLPIVPLIHGFGRLGCFCVGCCYGKPSERLGIAFAHSEIAPNGVPLLPVQLIEAALVFGLFFLLWQMSRRGMDGRRMLGWYLLVYSVGRFVLEFFGATRIGVSSASSPCLRSSRCCPYWAAGCCYGGLAHREMHSAIGALGRFHD